jgi:hypothetical protein
LCISFFDRYLTSAPSLDTPRKWFASMHAPCKDCFERVLTLIVDAPHTMTLLGGQLLNIDHGLERNIQ